MLNVLEDIPPGFLEIPVRELYRIVPEPTLLHLKGKRRPALFVSVLLHGNEPVGFLAVQKLLKKYAGQILPRDLTIFVGNVQAAKEGVRRFENQPDFNRVWLPGPAPEHAMTARILEIMRERGVFASVDLHNNTGLNPHYACVNRLDLRFFHLATLFSRTVVYFTRPGGVQTSAFADLCPAVTLECGQVGEERGMDHAAEFLEACLHLYEIPNHPVAENDLNLFHTVATVKVPPEYSIGFGEESADLRMIAELDRLNFTELTPHTLLGWTRHDRSARLQVVDEEGREVGERFFQYGEDEIRTRVSFMPSMFTLNKQIIRQDCLGYLMERVRLPSVSQEEEKESGRGP